jgi:hypothetical protein
MVKTAPIKSINKKIYLFFFTILIGLFVAILFHTYMYFKGMPHPWTTFLFDPNDRFNDWHNAIASSVTNNPYYTNSKAVPAYFPVTYKLMYFVSTYGRNLLTSIYFLISLTLICISVNVALKYMYKYSDNNRSTKIPYAILCTSLILSYPSLFSLDRGNIDIWIGALCLIFVSLLNTKFNYLGYAALILAICFKSYPLVFLALSVTVRDYKNILYTLALVLLLNLLALATMPSGLYLSYEGLKLGLAAYHNTYVINGHSLFATSDLYNPIRLVALELLLYFGSSNSTYSISKLSLSIVNWYGIFSFLLVLVNILIVLFVPIRKWRKIMLLGISALIFPNVANDYKLCILMPGLVALILEPGELKKGDFFLSTIFILLLIPKSYYFINTGTAGLYSLKNLLNPVLLIIAEWFLINNSKCWSNAFHTLSRRVIWYAYPITSSSVFKRFNSR